MNRYRLASIINDLRLETSKRFNISLGEHGYIVRVNASNYHVADRILDRGNGKPEKIVKILGEMMNSLADHYPCEFLHHARKNIDKETYNDLILTRKIDGKVFAVCCTMRMELLESGKYDVLLTIRTVITDYVRTVMEKDSIEINFVAPKIHFEYNGYRRCLSRLTKMIESLDCPESLKVLRFR
ncbi:hypothetical protein POP12_088 [Pectobacterium phage POP12]|nr:hypothetical protein POP12_088 [Pectobacterium phage POP12]